jgi:hypothetical protein
MTTNPKTRKASAKPIAPASGQHVAGVLNVQQRDDLAEIRHLVDALDLAILGDASLRMEGISPLSCLAGFISARLNGIVEEIEAPTDSEAHDRAA